MKEEISDDNARLPCFNGRVVSWVRGLITKLLPTSAFLGSLPPDQLLVALASLFSTCGCSEHSSAFFSCSLPYWIFFFLDSSPRSLGPCSLPFWSFPLVSSHTPLPNGAVFSHVLSSSSCRQITPSLSRLPQPMSLGQNWFLHLHHYPLCHQKGPVALGTQGLRPSSESFTF